jgi:hypothetical protein
LAHSAALGSNLQEERILPLKGFTYKKEDAESATDSEDYAQK